MTRTTPTALALLATLFASTAVRAADPKPLAAAKHPLGVTVEVTAVTLDDTQDKLKVTWVYRNPTKRPIRILEASPSGGLVSQSPSHAFFKELNFTAGKLSKDDNYRYSVLRTTNKKDYDATNIRKGILVPAEGSFEMYARFGKPPATAKTIHLQLPDLEPLENLPVSAEK